MGRPGISGDGKVTCEGRRRGDMEKKGVECFNVPPLFGLLVFNDNVPAAYNVQSYPKCLDPIGRPWGDWLAGNLHEQLSV